MSDQTQIPSTIAIDGPAASGKSTLALALADCLDYLYFDTGVMYRAVTLAAIERGVALSDEDAVAAVARDVQIDVTPPTVDDDRPSTVLLDGDDVTWAIREARIDQNVSVPSSYRGVRDEMTRQQRRIAERGDVVMVGRDIGTVVLPDADLKLYVTASVEERAQRRYAEYQRNGQGSSYEDILAAMRQRDKLDSEREVAPLRPADDAVVIDTTALDAGDVLERVLDMMGADDMCDSEGE